MLHKYYPPIILITAPDGFEPSNTGVKDQCLNRLAMGHCAVPKKERITHLHYIVSSTAMKPTFFSIVILCEAFCLLSHHSGATRPHRNGRIRTCNSRLSLTHFADLHCTAFSPLCYGCFSLFSYVPK